MERASETLIWNTIREYSDVPSTGRTLFAGNLATKNALWREFHAFVDQARNYWQAARSTPGSSSALLYYYCFLNLAKAELLQTNPSTISNQSIHHGLAWRPSKGLRVKGDTVFFRPGVFGELLAKRTGHKLNKKGDSCQVGRIIPRVPEIGTESHHLGMEPLFTGLIHAIVGDHNSAWPLILTYGSPTLNGQNEPVAVQFRKRFTQHLGSSIDGHATFGLSRRTGIDLGWVWESRDTFSTLTGKPDSFAATSHTWDALMPHVVPIIDATYDLVVTTSLFKTRLFPMTSDLARYVLMFYLSSLVRYKPTVLDPRISPEDAWLSESFLSQAPMSMLDGALRGILNARTYYEGSDPRA